jgi:hypothetical protein
MDLIKDSMDDVARECGVAVPSLWAANTDDTYQSLKMYMYQTARELLQRVDWQLCNLNQVITGTGVDTYALNSDFKRPTRGTNTVYGNSPQRWAFAPITSNGDWTKLQSWGALSTYFYQFTGTDLQFSQVINSPDEITLSYITKNWISSGGSRTDAWTTDLDLSYLPVELLYLGTVWRWKRKQGLDYASIMGEFETELTRYSNDDRNQQKISFNKTLPDRLLTPYDITPPGILGPAP